MATSAIPAVIDALVSIAKSIETVTVTDGFNTTDEPGDFLMIGVDDPDNESSAQSADSQQDWASVNPGAINENGQITCAALSWNGDGNMKAARDAAFATCALLATAIRNDRTLGGLPALQWARYGATQSLTQNQDENGAMATVVFQVVFHAYI